MPVQPIEHRNDGDTIDHTYHIGLEVTGNSTSKAYAGFDSSFDFEGAGSTTNLLV